MNESIIESLRELLLDGSAGTQEDLCLALEALGYEANQSKVSRLLRKIGAVKGKNEFGQIVYRLPQEPAPLPPSCQLSGLVLDIVANETSIVVTTSPGCASMIARILDHQKRQCEILGTIAGDDTILVIPKFIKQIESSFQSIKAVLFS